MFRYNIIILFLLYKYAISNELNSLESSENFKNLTNSLIDFFDFDISNVNISKECTIKLISNLINNPTSKIKKFYLGSSLNKNDINTYSSCINYYEGDVSNNLTYLTVFLNKNKTLYNVLNERDEEADFLTGICFIDGCKEDEYKEILLSITNSIYHHRYNMSKNETKEKYNKNDIKIYLLDKNQKSVIIILLELIPFIIIILHIFFCLFNSIPIFIINCFVCIFCCKKNHLSKIKSKSALKRLSKLNINNKKPFKPVNSDRIPSVATVKSSKDNFQKSLELLYRVEINFTSSSYQKHSQIINNSGLAYVNGIKGIFMILLILGNTYIALYGGFIAEKSKKNFFSQLKNFLFVFFYVGIRYAPKMLLCTGGFSLFFKFIFFLDSKMDEEIELSKQNEESSKEMNSSSNSSSRFYTKFLSKNKEKPILPFKHVLKFYVKQLNKYIIYILFLCFIFFSFNRIVILLRDQTPSWDFFIKYMIETVKKKYYLFPLLLIGFKSHLIPVISNNDTINILDYFYLPFQEILFFLITSLIIFIGYRNNYNIDRFFKIIGILIFAYRIIYYCLSKLDNKDYFSFNRYGKFYNSMLYNYNFYIIGISFGMINYVLHRGFDERDINLKDKIFLFSTTKFLKYIRSKKKKVLNVISIISVIIIILFSFFQQILVCFYDFYKEDDLQKYKNNIFAQVIMFFDADIYVILFNLMALCQYIRGDNLINNFFRNNFWSIFNNFYFTYIIIINPVILYIIYTTDTKLIFNLSTCFLFTFICAALVFSITLIIYHFFELPLKKLINFLLKLKQNDLIKERLSTIENNPEQNMFANVTASITDIIDEDEDEEI